jgi:hypothetical protein
VDGEPPPGDLDGQHLAEVVVVRGQVDVRHVARAVEAHLQPMPIRLQRAVGLPVGRGIAVERREWPVLRELREAGRERRADRGDASEHRDRLRIRAGERRQ